jgi:hypothetical protein
MATPFRGQDAVVRVVLRVWARLLILVGLTGGCSSPPTSLVESPLSVEQQQRAVLDLVPVGSTRDEAERRLKAAGIEYTASRSQSIYYLSLWNRRDGERWHINVALLFDGEGKLYASRPADAAVERMSAASASAGQPGWRKAGLGIDAPPAAANGDEDARVPFPGQSNAPGAAR